MESRVIPIFPLNVVLFPGMVLPLRIFEPRYRLMIKRLMAGDRQFGVALIQEGQEVGTPATPYPVGTIAEINGHEVVQDGQVMIVAVGVRRYKTLRRVEGEPYQQAEIEVLEEGEPEDVGDAELVKTVSETLETYLKGLSAVTTIAITIPDAPLSPIDLSYLVSATLQVDNERKQDLLETASAEERLKKGLAMLEKENQRIEKFLEKGRSRGDFFFRGNRLSAN